MTPQARATNGLSGARAPYARSVVRNDTQTQGRRLPPAAAASGYASSFITPEVRPANRPCEVRPTADSRVASRGSVRSPGYVVTPARGGSRDHANNREVGVVNMAIRIGSEELSVFCLL